MGASHVPSTAFCTASRTCTIRYEQRETAVSTSDSSVMTKSSFNSDLLPPVSIAFKLKSPGAHDHSQAPATHQTRALSFERTGSECLLRNSLERGRL